MTEEKRTEWTKRGKTVIATPAVKRKIGKWRFRIYKRFGKFRDFIQLIGVKESRFSAWLNQRNLPSQEFFDKIEKILEESGA